MKEIRTDAYNLNLHLLKLEYIFRKTKFIGSYGLIVFISAVLFGQVFISVFTTPFGLENRYFMLILRGCLAAYSSYIVLYALRTSKILFSNGFVLSLCSFWAFYFFRLIWDFWIVGINLKLPLWEFYAWGLGSCFLPALAGFILSSHHSRKVTAFAISSLGLLLLGLASIAFLANVGLESPRFMLKDLNPINASHAFFALSLTGLSSLFWSARNALSRLISLSACAFGFAMGIYAGSRGAFLSFVIASFVLVFLFAKDCERKAVMPACLALASFISLVAFIKSDFSMRLLSSGFDNNSLMRLSAIRESFNNFWLYPWTGVGFELHNNIGNLSSPVFNGHSIWYPHNFVAEAMGLGGLLLIVPFLGCLWFAFTALGVLKGGNSEYWRIALLIQGLGFCMFSGHLSNVPMFWVCLGIAASSSNAFRDKCKYDDLPMTERRPK